MKMSKAYSRQTRDALDKESGKTIAWIVLFIEVYVIAAATIEALTK